MVVYCDDFAVFILLSESLYRVLLFSLESSFNESMSSLSLSLFTDCALAFLQKL